MVYVVVLRFLTAGHSGETGHVPPLAGVYWCTGSGDAGGAIKVWLRDKYHCMIEGTNSAASGK
jgi:hypothetical protein